MEEEAKGARAKRYESAKNRLFLLDIFLTLAGLIFLIVGESGGVSGRISALLYASFPNNWCANAIYVVILSIAAFVFFLPVNFYKGYVLEHKFGLSRQTIGGWVWDKAKSFLISLLLSLVVIEAVYFLLRTAGVWWWVWAGALWIFFSIVLSHIAPVLLIPVFFKLTPLKEDTPLAGKLRSMAEKAGVKVLGIFEIDLSKKTKKANAAFTGIGSTKRILLADTLLKGYSSREIETILAHELGHYRGRHIWKLLTLGVLTTFAGLFLCSRVLSACVLKLGFSSAYDIGSFPVFALVLFLFMLVTLPVNNMFSRRLERQADRFSLNITGNPAAFISSMKKLAGQNLADINPNPIIHFLTHSHPSISERINMAEGYRK